MGKCTLLQQFVCESGQFASSFKKGLDLFDNKKEMYDVILKIQFK